MKVAHGKITFLAFACEPGKYEAYDGCSDSCGEGYVALNQSNNKVCMACDDGTCYDGEKCTDTITKYRRGIATRYYNSGNAVN